MTNNTNHISHEGVIESIGEDIVKVRIVQSSACAGCKIASHCTTAESKVKVIEVTDFPSGTLSVGDEVKVVAAESAGKTAVIFGFILPFVILVGIISFMYLIGSSEAMAALSGIAALIPYYIIIFFCRSYFSRIITFHIELSNNQ